MKFRVVKSCSSNVGGTTGARTGVLQLDNIAAPPIQTPALLISTRKGLPCFITPDLLNTLPSPNSLLFLTSPLHFWGGPSTKTISSLGGLANMVGLPRHGFIAAPRDSIVCLPDYEGTNKLGASLETPFGRMLVKPADYMEKITSMNPNLWVSLPDEVPSWVGEKRNVASVNRTIRWLDECISLDPEGGKSVLGAVVGGCSLEERKRSALEVSMRNVAGFWIGGFGLGETMTERSSLLHAITDILPAQKLRQVCGLELPEAVLQGVAAGIDLFDSTYIYHLTLGGFALVFSISGEEDHASNHGLDESGTDHTKINLHATVFRKDTSPILARCSCYTCKNHSKAYINHLLNVHEMLAQILLEIHNTYHYTRFFQSIRNAILLGEFNSFHEKFVERRRGHVVSAV